MSNHSKYNEEQFSMRSLESEYLPRMFSENQNEDSNEEVDSFDSIPSTRQDHRGDGKSSTNVSFIDLQSPTSLNSRRMEPYTLDKIGEYKSTLYEFICEY